MTRLKLCSMVNALGNDLASIMHQYMQGQSPGMQSTEHVLPEQSAMLGHVLCELPEIPAALSRHNSRNNRLILKALAPIEAELKAAIAELGADNVAIVFGTSTSGIKEGEEAYAAFVEQGQIPSEFDYAQQEIGNPAIFLKQYLELNSAAYTVSTACSSSAKVFSSAQQLLDAGLAEAVIVGGADALCKLTVNGFTALEATTPNNCRPFSANREGINIGEAAAIFLMTKESGGIQLKAVGTSSDAHHISAPHPEGDGAEVAMRQAIERAGLSADDIFYMNLHGTATPHNDAMEAKAFNRVFGASTHASSTKPLTGHTLGAAGATEVGLCWGLLCLSQTQTMHLAPQINDGVWDVDATPIGALKEPVEVPAKGRLYMQSNSFAFGGSNCSVVIGRE